MLRCACGCGGTFRAHRSTSIGRPWVRFIRGHANRLPERRELSKKLGSLNLTSWHMSDKGKAKSIILGRSVGLKYGKVNGGIVTRKKVKHEILFADKLKGWGN